NLTNLEELNLTFNNLSEIDLSNNTNIRRLLLEGNNLTSINLDNIINTSNEIELSLDTYLYSMVNLDGISNLYLENNFVILPGDVININDFLSDYEISEKRLGDALSFYNGVITGLKEGYSRIQFNLDTNKYYYVYVIVLDKIESEDYEIDYDNRYLYVGSDTDEEIKNNLSYEYKYFINAWCDETEDEGELRECFDEIEEEGTGYEIRINNNNLKFLLIDDGDIFPINYKLGRINLSDYEVNDNVIAASSFDVDDIEYSNVTIEYEDNTLIVKDLSGNEVDRYQVQGSNNNNNPPTPSDNDEDDNNGSPTPSDNDEDDNNGSPTPSNNDTNNNSNNNTTNSNNTTSSNDNVTTKSSNDNTTKKTTLNKFEKNAKTYDDIVKYFIIGGISVVLIAGIIIYTKKKK
ncbi:MAG: hypothetical protein IJH34_16030, partial [Romboutsia sp.]|nr:hypothetical protein [Romboutsia sp.]